MNIANSRLNRKENKRNRLKNAVSFYPVKFLFWLGKRNSCPHFGQRIIFLALGINTLHSTEPATNFRNVAVFLKIPFRDGAESRHVERKHLLAGELALGRKENVEGEPFAYRKLEAPCVSFETENRFREGQ